MCVRMCLCVCVRDRERVFVCVCVPGLCKIRGFAVTFRPKTMSAISTIFIFTKIRLTHDAWPYIVIVIVMGFTSMYMICIVYIHTK